ncbi:Citrate synthase (si) [Minicystis rosea]|nr:Citrate synthase (si) [Minicystis rosea]
MGNVDQRGFVNQPSAIKATPAWLSGAEAAAFLGVKRETLYAYASRGLVRSEPGEKGRGRRYRREDLVRIKARSDARAGHGPVAAGALRWGEPVLESALTAIDEGGPRYRGHAAVGLADRSSFEAVAELLWTGALPDERPAWRAEGLGLRAASLAALLPDRCHPLTVLSVAVPAIGAGDPGRFDATMDAERKRARALILRMAALLGFTGESHAQAREAAAAESVARAALIGLGARPTARAERAVDRALVLIADHELNASAFTVRVAASARADLYACVSAGLATLSGPRHGGVCDRVEALVAETKHPARARQVIEERMRNGAGVPGFGHPLYPAGDPRATAMLAAAIEIAPRNAGVATMRALVEAMHALGHEPPTSDIGLVSLTLALGLPPGSAAALFALGRTAGWVAHAFEQREAEFLLRPRARYVGPPAAP